jgi:hypothetical protein
VEVYLKPSDSFSAGCLLIPMWVTIPKDDDQDLRVTEAKEHERRRRLREMLYVPIRNYGVSKICVVESMLMLTKKIDVQKVAETTRTPRSEAQSWEMKEDDQMLKI